MWRVTVWRAALFFLITTLLVGQTGQVVAQTPDPRELGPYSTAILLIDYGCTYDLDGQSISWTDPAFGYTTPETVYFNDWDPGTQECPNDPGKVKMFVRVHHPGTPGNVEPGSWPVVVILHGEQLADIPGFEGYDYLGELLASHGFIVVSIDGRSALRTTTIASRGELIREHLRLLVEQNAPGSGSILEGHLEMSQVSLVGHSRGGDAIVAAWEWQRVDTEADYDIDALVAIAPVQFFGNQLGEPTFVSHVRDVAYQIIHGSKDGDVSDFQGLRQYDRAADIREMGETLKSMAFVKDANHNYFNTVWEVEEGNEYPGPTLSASEIRDVAKVYIHSFLQVVIKGDNSYLPYLTNEVNNPMGLDVAIDYQAKASQFANFDNHEELPGVPHDPFTNSRGAEVHIKRPMTGYDELLTDRTAGNPLNTYPGETYAAYLKWQTLFWFFHGSYVSDYPLYSFFDPEVENHLSFRVAQVYREFFSPNPPGANQDFEVGLEDWSGNLALVQVSDYAPIYSPWENDFTGVDGPKTVMSVVRIPLVDFEGVDLYNLRRIGFYFLVEDSGEIVVDDIRFTE